MTSEKSTRDTGLDLLRIFLAILVVSIHVNAGGTGKVLSTVNVAPFTQIVGGVTALCYPAVNCYVMLSGFFLWNKKKTYVSIIKSLLKLWLSLIFFQIFGYFFVTYITNNTVSLFEAIKRLFPIVRGTWWYMTVYFGLMLLTPFLNMIINQVNRQQFNGLLFILIVLFQIMPMVVKWEDAFGLIYGYGLLWFFDLYFTGAYISKYDCSFNFKSHKLLKGISLFLLFTVCILFVSKVVNRVAGTALYLTPYNSIFTYFQSIVLFLAFRKIDFKSKGLRKIIISIASVSMASYILHCQEDIGPWIWDTFRPDLYANSYKIILVYIGIVTGVLVVGLILESLRRMIFKGFETWLLGIVDKVNHYFVKKFENAPN